jgi:uncharacterized delta-60 repeat protein
VWTAAGVAVDAQGRILVSGPSNDPMLPPAEIVRRFTSDGALDETFGGGGHVTVPVSASQWGQVVHVGPTGSVGVLGAATVDGDSGSFAAILTSGDLDEAGVAAKPEIATFSGPFETGVWEDDGSGFLMSPEATVRFGADGTVDVGYGAGGQLAAADTGALGPDEKLWTASGTMVRRYLADGSIDTAFGQMGAVDIPPVAPDTTIHNLVVSASGAVVVASHVANQMNYIDVAHVGVDGTVDAAFDATAAVATEGGPVGAASIASGLTWVWTAEGSLILYGADNSLEGAFGLDAPGTVLAATLDPAGRFIAVGIDSSDTQDSRWFVRRYNL